MCQPEVITRLYVDVVQNRLGLPAQPDSEGDVVVVLQGVKFILVNSAPNDPEYLRVMIVGRFDAEPELLESIVAGFSSRKAVRGTTRENSVMLSYESFVAGHNCVPSAELLAAVLPRIFDALLGALGALFTGIELAGIAKVSGVDAEAV